MTDKTTTFPLRATGTHFWPARDGYDVRVEGGAHFQGSIEQVVKEIPSARNHVLCVARLVPRGRAWLGTTEVDVFVRDRHVGLLSGGDARQFVGRLAALNFNGRPTNCSARIDTTGHAKGHFLCYSVRLGIEPFEAR